MRLILIQYFHHLLHQCCNKDYVLQSKWKSPSNIALIKYWGKRGNQLPQNPSLSFTLSKSYTETSVTLKNGKSDLLFLFEGQENNKFKDKIVQFIQKNEFFHFLNDYDVKIESRNTFPHSAGIASSASSMSALVLCLLDLAKELKLLNENDFFQRASFYSRLASGSASRSVYGGVVEWGTSEYVPGSSDEEAVQIDEIHPVFKSFQDSILIVDSNEKSVSSRAGHSLMEHHPFRHVRYQHAQDQLHQLLVAMRNGQVEQFIQIVEQEALELHGLMMNSNPSFILLKPNTLKMIELIRSYRQKSGVPVSFTLDAGPNVHLLYPEHVKSEVHSFIKQELISLTVGQNCLHDCVGLGPSKL